MHLALHPDRSLWLRMASPAIPMLISNPTPAAVVRCWCTKCRHMVAIAAQALLVCQTNTFIISSWQQQCAKTCVSWAYVVTMLVMLVMRVGDARDASNAAGDEVLACFHINRCHKRREKRWDFLIPCFPPCSTERLVLMRSPWHLARAKNREAQACMPTVRFGEKGVIRRHLDSLRGKLDEAAAWLHSDGTAKSDGQSSVLQLAVNSTQEGGCVKTGIWALQIYYRGALKESSTGTNRDLLAAQLATSWTAYSLMLAGFFLACLFDRCEEI